MNNLQRLIKELNNKDYRLKLKLGTFELKKTPLGQGGNGIVFEGIINGKNLALKFLVLDSTGQTNEIKRQRFISEYFHILMLENLQNIIRYVDYDTICINDEIGYLEVPVIIMYKYECSLVKIQSQKSEEGFTSLFNFLVTVTKQIHNEGIIHRDIKPQNILVKDNKFYLADFGIASYNPEIFQILAETEKNERLGNRHFSAPEQEMNNIDADVTMDIFAIGQNLQWYATGSTHRGTGRKSIVTIFPEFQVYDQIIEKCLENDPKKRFQCVDEITRYFDNSRKKDIYTYLFLFHEISIKSFPRNDHGIVHSDMKIKIDRFFNNLLEKQDLFEDKLCWIDGSGESDFKLVKKGNGIWKFNTLEFDITDIWLFYDSRVYNDFAFIHYQKSIPFIVNGKEIFHTAILNETHHLAYSEFQNRFAEINDDIIDLSTQHIEHVNKQEKEGYLFIGSFGSCIIEPKNEDYIRNFIANIKKNEINEELLMFTREISKNKNEEVYRRL